MMIKLAKRHDVLVSLVVIEEHFAKELGLQQWKCSCGASFLTFYYCAYHVEKHHQGEKLQDRISMLDNAKYDRKIWELFYTNVSDNINATIGKKHSSDNMTQTTSCSVTESSTQTTSPPTEPQNEGTSSDVAKSNVANPLTRKRSCSSDLEIIEVKRAKESPARNEKVNDCEDQLEPKDLECSVQTEQGKSNCDEAEGTPPTVGPEQVQHELPALMPMETPATRYSARDIFRTKLVASPQKASVATTISLKLPTQLKIKPARPMPKSLPETIRKKRKRKLKNGSNPYPDLIPSRPEETENSQPELSQLNPGGTPYNAAPASTELNSPSCDLLSLPSPSYYDPEEEEELPARFVAKPKLGTGHLVGGRITPKKQRVIRKPAVESDSEFQEDLQIVREIPYNQDVTERIGMELRKEPSEADEQSSKNQSDIKASREEQGPSGSAAQPSVAGVTNTPVVRKKMKFIASTKSHEVVMEDPRIAGPVALWSVYQNGYQPKDDFETFQVYVNLLNEKTNPSEENQELVEQHNTSEGPHYGLMSHTNTPSDADIASTSASALASPAQLHVAQPPPPAEPYGLYHAEACSAYAAAYGYCGYVPPMIQGRNMMIPHPSYYPYPDFTILFTPEALFHPDGSPTLHQLAKWENFFLNIWKNQLDPYEAHESWMIKFAPKVPRELNQSRPAVEMQSAELQVVEDQIRQKIKNTK